ncbi:MAG: sigma 54-interacting transcriptional regulator OrpR [Geothermobacteraceae bacterium]
MKKKKTQISTEALLDSIADGVFTVDKDMRITSFNKAAGILTGIRPEDAIGRPCATIFHSEVCSSSCPLREARETGQPVLDRLVAIHRHDGKRLPVSISASVLRNEKGDFVGGVETIRSRRQINIILDSVADGVFTVDEHMNIQTFNKAAEELTGISYAEAIGRPCHEVFKSSVCQSACPVREALNSGHPVLNREVEIKTAKGHPKPVSVSASSLTNVEGKILGAVETMRDLSLERTLKEEIQQKYTFKNLVSRNHEMHRLFNIMKDVAVSDATVFLQGESGTGKELFARAIHDLSPRRDNPLVVVNCGALPENLLEAEIFGVRKGAYTGAHEDRPGRLDLCKGGTFFLDEIGDLPLSLQVKLLRVLENREYQPVGGKTVLKADVRFIAATHRNLEEMVANGSFRRDLYYRINIVNLTIPPLRKRQDDIPLLLDVAIQRFNAIYKKKIKSVSPDVLKLLLNYHFPGNVRELLNLIEQAAIICKGDQIQMDHIPESFLHQATGTNGHYADVSSTFLPQKGKLPNAELLKEVLNRHQGNREDAAAELGISRTTLWRWMKQLGL